VLLRANIKEYTGNIIYSAALQTAFNAAKNTGENPIMSEQVKTTHFGSKQVPLVDKQGMVNEVFDGVASRYDLMNDLMSAGIHRLWKDALVAKLNPPRGGTRPYRVLDMAGGSGDIGERIVNASHGYAQVVVSDINQEMLNEGIARQKNWRFSGQAEFIRANAEELPFEDASFNAYTIAVGIRNVPRIDKALEEAFRVLKRGGKFLCLEFSQPDIAILDKAYESFSNNVIPKIGKIVTGNADPYTYLVESIRQFPSPEKFIAMIENAGFKHVTHTPLTGNIAAIHSGIKI